MWFNVPERRCRIFDEKCSTVLSPLYSMVLLIVCGCWCGRVVSYVLVMRWVAVMVLCWRVEALSVTTVSMLRVRPFVIAVAVKTEGVNLRGR